MLKCFSKKTVEILGPIILTWDTSELADPIYSTVSTIVNHHLIVSILLFRKSTLASALRKAFYNRLSL